MVTPTVSVALCTYNGERFVREQLESILAQSFRPVEIVVSDDGSSDATVEIVRDTLAAAKDAPRLTLLQNTAPLGVAANFAAAIGACVGDLVALSDQDDVWHSDRLEVLVESFMVSPDLLLLHGDAELIDAAGAPIGESLFDALEVTADLQAAVHDGGAFEVLMRRNIVTGATTGFRRSLAATALPVPDGWLHDEWLAIVAAAGGQIDLTPKRLIEYRQHGGNEIGVRRLSVFGRFRRMTEPGSERSARLLRRAVSLDTRLTAVPGVSTVRLDAVKAKLAHERVRSVLRRNRLRRVAPVLREYRTGRYGEFGRGASDAVRDILQPLPDAR